LTGRLREPYKKYVFLQEPLSSQSVYFSIIENECRTVVASGVTAFTPPNVVFGELSVVTDRRRTKTKVRSLIRRLLVEQVEVHYDLTVDLTALGQSGELFSWFLMTLYLLTDRVQTETTVIAMGYIIRKK
jgi:hypothetical protein